MHCNPKIGIRPTIDGRMNGVRESLEDQTMGMAKRVATLLSSRLRYADGTPVECVISDTTIGRVAEAAACAEKFAREGVAITRPWTWTRTRSRPYGASTARSGRARCTSPPSSPRMHRKACLLSASMVTTCKTRITRSFRPMSRKSSSASPAPPSPPPPCGASRTCPSAPSAWASPVPS